MRAFVGFLVPFSLVQEIAALIEERDRLLRTCKDKEVVSLSLSLSIYIYVCVCARACMYMRALHCIKASADIGADGAAQARRVHSRA